jgi:hypothetical protein
VLVCVVHCAFAGCQVQDKDVHGRWRVAAHAASESDRLVIVRFS